MSENPAYESTGDTQQVVVDVPDQNGKKDGSLDAGFTSIKDVPEEKPRAEKPYAGMGKEDLLRFSDTPFWNRFRMACLVSSGIV